MRVPLRCAVLFSSLAWPGLASGLDYLYPDFSLNRHWLDWDKFIHLRIRPLKFADNVPQVFLVCSCDHPTPRFLRKYISGERRIGQQETVQAFEAALVRAAADVAAAAGGRIDCIHTR